MKIHRRNLFRSIEQRNERDAFTGDKCKQQSLGQWELERQSKKNQHITCYIGHFPESGFKTYMQSNDDDDYNAGFFGSLIKPYRTRFLNLIIL